MAALRLNTAERKHEAAGAIAPVRTHRHRAYDIKGSDDLAGDANPYLTAQVDAHQRAMYQQ